MVMASLSEVFNDKQLSLLLNLYHEHKSDGRFAHMAKYQVIDPAIDTINRLTGQPNDPMYLAYLVEFTFRALEKAAKAA
jgi:hypothetical protein